MVCFLFFYFYFLQKPNTILEPEYQPLAIKNISTLPVNVLLSTGGPFFICETDKSLLPSTPEVTRQRGAMCVIKKENSISALPSFSPEKSVKNLGNREENSKMSQI